MPETTFGQRVKLRREELGLTQERLADLLQQEGDHGRSVASISSWEKYGKVPPVQVIGYLAKALRVSRLWLAWGVGDKENENGTHGVGFRTQRGRIVPRLSVNAAVPDLARSVGEAANSFSVHTYFDCGPKTFVMEIKDRSNVNPLPGKSFEPGDAVAIDPEEEPVPGDMVFAVLYPGDRVLFRRFQQRTNPDGSKFIELTPLNPDWDADRIHSAEDGRIVGVMTEHVIPRR